MFEEFAKNLMLDALTITWVQLLDDGGGPINSRQAITVDAAVGGERAASTQPSFSVPPETTVAGAEFWDDEMAGNLIAEGDLTPEEFVSSGTYTLDSAIFRIVDEVV